MIAEDKIEGQFIFFALQKLHSNDKYKTNLRLSL